MTMRKEDVPVRISRWALFLHDFDYVIEYPLGTLMVHEVALSRAACLVNLDSLQNRIKEAHHDDRINV